VAAPLLAGFSFTLVGLRGLAVLLAMLGFLAELAWIVISEII